MAGTGGYGFSEGDGRATEAMFANPLGIALDGAGHLFIADTFNQRVRKMDLFGGITTVAGTGVRGFSGDGGPATDAVLGNPSGVFVDGAGSIWIADQDNHRIRKVDTTGKMTTVAGNGHKGFDGDGGPATEAKLADPRGVFVDTDGVLWIADRSNHRIRRVDPSGVIETVAGTGLSGFSGDGGPATEAQLRIPSRVFKDMFGNLLIVDRGNNRIRRVDPSGGITTVTGNGMLTIADTENHRIRQVLPPQRTLQIEKSVVSIAADGQDGAIILARVTDLEGIRHLMSGSGL